MTDVSDLHAIESGRCPAADRHRTRPDDRVFRTLSRGASAFVLVVMALIFLFLLTRGWDALHRAGWGFFTRSQWNPEGGTFGIAAALFGTVLIAGIAFVHRGAGIDRGRTLPRRVLARAGFSVP